MTTGKVNPMAASGRVPKRATKYVSARLNVVMANVPASMGTAMLNSVRTTEPWVKLGRVCACDTDSSLQVRETGDPFAGARQHHLHAHCHHDKPGDSNNGAQDIEPRQDRRDDS